MKVNAGSTNVSVYYYIVQDASATSPGEPVTGLLFSDIETGGSASYARQGAARVDLTLITLASASATHADGGFILVDDTNMPGLYRCDYPDAAFVTGVDLVTCQIVVATAKNAVAAPVAVELTLGDVNVLQVSGDATAADNLELDYDGTGYDKSNSTIGTTTTNTDMRGTDGALTDKAGFSLSTAGILALWHQAVSAIVTAGSIGKLLKDEITSARMAELDAANMPSDLGNIESDTTAILVDTGTSIPATLGTAGAGLTDLGGMSAGMKAEITVQVNLALDTAISELAVAVPTATPTIRTALMLPYMGLRNQFITQTSGVDAVEFHNNAGTLITKKLITDDGSDYTEAKMS